MYTEKHSVVKNKIFIDIICKIIILWIMLEWLRAKFSSNKIHLLTAQLEDFSIAKKSDDKERAKHIFFEIFATLKKNKNASTVSSLLHIFHPSLFTWWSNDVVIDTSLLYWPVSQLLDSWFSWIEWIEIGPFDDDTLATYFEKVWSWWGLTDDAIKVHSSTHTLVRKHKVSVVHSRTVNAILNMFESVYATETMPELEDSLFALKDKSRQLFWILNIDKNDADAVLKYFDHFDSISDAKAFKKHTKKILTKILHLPHYSDNKILKKIHKYFNANKTKLFAFLWCLWLLWLTISHVDEVLSIFSSKYENSITKNLPKDLYPITRSDLESFWYQSGDTIFLEDVIELTQEFYENYIHGICGEWFESNKNTAFTDACDDLDAYHINSQEYLLVDDILTFDDIKERRLSEIRDTSLYSAVEELDFTILHNAFWSVYKRGAKGIQSGDVHLGYTDRWNVLSLEDVYCEWSNQKYSWKNYIGLNESIASNTVFQWIHFYNVGEAAWISIDYSWDNRQIYIHPNHFWGSKVERLELLTHEMTHKFSYNSPNLTFTEWYTDRLSLASIYMQTWEDQFDENHPYTDFVLNNIIISEYFKDCSGQNYDILKNVWVDLENNLPQSIVDRSSPCQNNYEYKISWENYIFNFRLLKPINLDVFYNNPRKVIDPRYYLTMSCLSYLAELYLQDDFRNDIFTKLEPEDLKKRCKNNVYVFIWDDNEPVFVNSNKDNVDRVYSTYMVTPAMHRYYEQLLDYSIDEAVDYFLENREFFQTMYKSSSQRKVSNFFLAKYDKGDFHLDTKAPKLSPYSISKFLERRRDYPNIPTNRSLDLGSLIPDLQNIVLISWWLLFAIFSLFAMWWPHTKNRFSGVNKAIWDFIAPFYLYARFILFDSDYALYDLETYLIDTENNIFTSFDYKAIKIFSTVLLSLTILLTRNYKSMRFYKSVSQAKSSVEIIEQILGRLDKTWLHRIQKFKKKRKSRDMQISSDEESIVRAFVSSLLVKNPITWDYADQPMIVKEKDMRSVSWRINIRQTWRLPEGVYAISKVIQFKEKSSVDNIQLRVDLSWVVPSQAVLNLFLQKLSQNAITISSIDLRYWSDLQKNVLIQTSHLAKEEIQELIVSIVWYSYTRIWSSKKQARRMKKLEKLFAVMNDMVQHLNTQHTPNETIIYLKEYPQKI